MDNENQQLAAPELTEAELAFLREAADYLENPSFLMKLANVVGQPLEWTARAVIPEAVARASTRALGVALETALVSLPGGRLAGDSFSESRARSGWSSRLHQAATSVTGAVGGFFGLPGLVVELPITTTVMLRAIADVARQSGEDLRDRQVQLECLTVFSHAGPTAEHDELDSAYLTTRLATARLIKDASRFVASQSAKSLSRHLAEGSAPLLVRLVAQIAARFKIVVSQKVLAQSLPVIGAGTGAVVNLAFTDHFTRVAGFHFGIRQLERRHGRELVQQQYRRLALRQA